MKPGMGNETKHRNETEWETKRRPFTKHENCFQELIALPQHNVNDAKMEDKAPW